MGAITATDASCQVTWQQEINETGVRKASLFRVKSIRSCESCYGKTHYDETAIRYVDSAEFGHIV
ncbi:hypothetical protein OH492_05450 [Vibrio chagasii]|nr:hypothetical protein [Vibrio chagasii]